MKNQIFGAPVIMYEKSIKKLNETGSTTTPDGKVLNANKLLISKETLEKLKKIKVNVSHS